MLTRRKLVPVKGMKQCEVRKAQWYVAFRAIRQHTAALWVKHAVTPEIKLLLSFNVLRVTCVSSMLRPMVTTFET